MPSQQYKETIGVGFAWDGFHLKTIIFALALFSTPCLAATVTMDISDLAGFTQSGASGTSGNGVLWVSPKYFFEPNTTVDFGAAIVIGDMTDHRAPCGPPTNFPCMAQTGSFKSYLLTDGQGGIPPGTSDLGSGYCVTTTDFCAPDVFRLLFTLGPDNDGIQLAFQGYSLRIDPIPLPAALPLFAAGLGLATFVARRKNRKPAAIPA